MSESAPAAFRSWPSSSPTLPSRSHGSSRPPSGRWYCSVMSGTGIPDEQVEAADLCVEIPMLGQGASLNVAVATSLVLYRLSGMS